MRIPKITIKDDDPNNHRGWKTINRSAFDPAKHTPLADAPEPPATPPQFVDGGQPAPAPEKEAEVAKLTRSQVYRMTKAELVENLEALDQPVVGNAAELKDRLISALAI
jgi:hypothetical protein